MPTAPDPDSRLGRLLGTFPRDGRVEWIGLRPARREPVVVVDEVAAEVGRGLVGDRWTPRAGGRHRRQVTLIQAEHLPVIAALAGVDALDPAVLRRNVVVSGINLLALKGRRIRVGDVVLALTSPCDPCSRMEEALGPGGYNAMRGHGGWNASVEVAGTIAVGSPVVHLGPDG
ncbi:MOSC domain-containing protein [Aquihabitans sp. G128]|uniref:MOSC domain-containing protein n=1 Tax=Aquihabitans sp. G128 TaxID=2849779 RepID=UPI001C219E98|nr:MOSC domain-containing protein [Aquihabitans sp. G128]QXC62978.1 MOSC domain-containing protein [Aquihabitans sp. G128]